MYRTVEIFCLLLVVRNILIGAYSSIVSIGKITGLDWIKHSTSTYNRIILGLGHSLSLIKDIFVFFFPRNRQFPTFRI